MGIKSNYPVLLLISHTTCTAQINAYFNCKNIIAISINMKKVFDNSKLF